MRAASTTEAEVTRSIRPEGGLRLILDALPVGVFIADADGRFVYVNSAARAIWQGESFPRSVEQYGSYRGWRSDTGEPLAPEEWGLARALQKGERSVEIVDIERFDGSCGSILNSAAPIILNGRVIGGLVAIQDVTEHRERQHLGDALNHLATLLAQVSDRQELLEQAMPIIAKALGADAALGGFARDGDYEITAVYQYPSSLIGLRLPPDQIRAARIAMRTGKPVAIDDAEADRRLNAGSIRRFGIKSALLTPFFDSRRRVGGGMLFVHTKATVPVTQPQCEFAENVTAMTSLFLQNVGLLRERQEALELRERLSALAAAAASSLQFEEVLKRVVAESAQAVGADSAMLLTVEDDHWVVRQAHNVPHKYMGRRYPRGEVAFSMESQATGEPMIIEDASSDTRVGMRELIEDLGVRGLLDIPILVDGKAFGNLCLHLHTGDRGFTDLHLDFARGAAAQVVLAIRNARAYERERQIAENLQEALLLLPANIKSARFGQAYKAASEAARVGGDFYDLLQVDDERVALVVGDVSGKGLDAARMMMTAKNAVRAYIFAGMSPAQALTLTNDLVYGLSESHQFVTAFVAVLDGCSGRIVYCSAGHLPSLILRSDGTLTALARISPLLGAFPHNRFEEAEEHLNAEDVLVLYTDGVVEARSRDGGMFGDRRLFELLKRSTPDARTLAAHILAEVERYSGERLSDDVAVLTASPRCDRR